MTVALFALPNVLAGCIVIQEPEYSTVSSRGFIEDAEVAQIQTGKTTREEILLRYGAPDVALRNQRLFVYSWDRNYGTVVPLLIGEPGPASREHVLLVEFDEDNVVRRVALKEGIGKDTAVQQFEAGQPR